MNFAPVGSSLDLINQYSKLFGMCFNNAPHLTNSEKAAKYLLWLYHNNPEGKAVGFDAWDKDILAAHYSTIPVRWSFAGTIRKGLLSLNTATHPDYRGKGLFTKLADKTYQTAAELGYEFVIGVANSNSTPGFLKKLDFTLVSSLEARVGVGTFPQKTRHTLNSSGSLIKHYWTQKSFSWRLSNPNNPARITKKTNPFSQVEACTDKSVIKAFTEIYLDENTEATTSSHSMGLRLMLGVIPEEASWGNYFPIPDRLKPSPLNLIFRNLQGHNLEIDKRHLYFNFLDFDAY
ncbi:GNAT family N-acetyltransferase [Kiloniella sp.]|uniref:GNAT family N-acetyltransferase n=1 Tax=Kiloniella sp. TaxID=1938587 RepID=UPI003A8CAE80